MCSLGVVGVSFETSGAGNGTIRGTASAQASLAQILLVKLLVARKCTDPEAVPGLAAKMSMRLKLFRTNLH